MARSGFRSASISGQDQTDLQIEALRPVTLGNSPFHTCNSGFPDCLDYRCPKICGLRWALEPSPLHERKAT